jgi:hypothetical protein
MTGRKGYQKMHKKIVILLFIFSSISFAQSHRYFENNELSLDRTIYISNCNDEIPLTIKLKVYTWHGGRKYNFDTRSYYLIRIYEQSDNGLIQEIIDSVDNWINFTKYKNLNFVYDGNFDGQMDLFLCNYSMLRDDKKYYNVFTFSCTDKKFIFNQELSGILNPHFNQNTSTIYSVQSSLEYDEIPVVDEYKLINDKIEKVATYSLSENREKLIDILYEIDYLDLRD